MKKGIIMSKSDKAQQPVSLLSRLLPPSLLTLITAIVYYPSLHYNFQFDDIANIQKHFYIRHHQFKNLFFSGSRWISYWLNALHYSIGKFDPLSFRVGNLIIHSINGTLLFLVVLFALLHSNCGQFFKKNALAIATATSMLFLLHPVQTQTVSYVIQGQLEGLACMFILAMALTFLHFCYNPSSVKRGFLLALLFVLAIFSCGTKEIAFISPFLIMLIDWFFVAHGSLRSFRKRLWLHGILFFIISSIYLYFLKPSFFTDILGFKMVINNNIGNIITEKPSDPIKAGIFFISQFKVILHYIWIFIWPFNISVEYDWVLVRHFFSPDCFFPLLLLLIIGYAIIRLLSKKPTNVIGFGALWFFACLAPRSSIIPSPELLVDYKTYTASIGWLLILSCAIVASVEWLIKKYATQAPLLKKSYTPLLLMYVLAVPLGFATHMRNLVWSEGTLFWMNVIKNAPRKARAYNNYGVELSQNYQRYEESIPYFKKAAQMDHYYPDPLNNLAVCYSHLNQTENAIEALQQGLKINRFYPEGYNNLATLYLQQKDYDQARKNLEIALQLRPHYGKAHFNLGRIHLEKGEDELALECFKKACTVADLDNEFGYRIYAQTAMRIQKYDEAIWGFKKTFECNPTDIESVFSIGNCFYLSQRYQESVDIYKQFLAHKPDDLRAWYNLGEAYLMQENIQAAFDCFKQVEPQSELMPQVRIRLANCYAKMKKPEIAYKELKDFFGTPKTPAHLKIQAKEFMAQLEKEYPQIQAEVLMG